MATHGTGCLIWHRQRLWWVCSSKSSLNPFIPANTILAASRPMAQSAVISMALAVFSIKISVSSSASPSNTCSKRFSSWPSPIRQGVHFPQLWAWHNFKKAAEISTGQIPGGLATIRRSNTLYKSSTTSWDLLTVLITKRLMFPSI